MQIPSPISSINSKTDVELVADATMVAAELSKLHIALAARCIENNLVSYDGGKLEVEYTRVLRTRI